MGPKGTEGTDTGNQTWGLIPVAIGAALFVWALTTAPKHGTIGAWLQVPEPTWDVTALYAKIAALT